MKASGSCNIQVKTLNLKGHEEKQFIKCTFEFIF